MIEELSHSNYFMTWHERLEEYRDLEPTARQVLDSLSVSDEGMTKELLIQTCMKGREGLESGEIRKNVVTVLDMLEHDGYILRQGEKRKFRSPLLRNWWKYKFMD